MINIQQKINPLQYHKNQPNVGKYTIHGSYGNEILVTFFGFLAAVVWFSLVIFVVSGISEHRDPRPLSWNFLMLVIPGAEGGVFS